MIKKTKNSIIPLNKARELSILIFFKIHNFLLKKVLVLWLILVAVVNIVIFNI